MSAFSSPPIPADLLAKTARSLGHTIVIAVPDPVAALAHAQNVASSADIIVCTGSHYWLDAVHRTLRQISS